MPNSAGEMASMTVAIVILMLFIENGERKSFFFQISLSINISILSTAFASTKSYNSVHKTKEAAEVKADLYCYSCDMMSDAENCVNINKTRERNLTRKCDPSQEFCSVKRFSKVFCLLDVAILLMHTSLILDLATR